MYLIFNFVWLINLAFLVLLTRKGAIPVVFGIVFALYNHTISLKLRWDSATRLGKHEFLESLFLDSSLGGEEILHILTFLFCSPRVILFVCVWLWAFSTGCRPGIWRQSGTSIWPEPRVQPAERSKFWITVDAVVFSRCSACSSCLRLGDKQHSALTVWTASDPTAGFWLRCPQHWWVPTNLFPFGLTDYIFVWLLHEVHLQLHGERRPALHTYLRITLHKNNGCGVKLFMCDSWLWRMWQRSARLTVSLLHKRLGTHRGCNPTTKSWGLFSWEI